MVRDCLTCRNCLKSQKICVFLGRKLTFSEHGFCLNYEPRTSYLASKPHTVYDSYRSENQGCYGCPTLEEQEDIDRGLPSSGLYFDLAEHRYVNPSSPSKTDRRRYHYLISGFTKGDHGNLPKRFMTLTTSVQAISRDLIRDFNAFKQAVSRATVKKDHFHGFKLNNYIDFHTSEGNGVLHVVYYGRFIPIDWIRATWARVHKSPVADIRFLHSRQGTKKLTNYLIGHYLQKQPTIRVSMGWRWLFLGASKAWHNIIMTYGYGWWRHSNGLFKNVLCVWDSLLRNPPPNSIQSHF